MKEHWLCIANSCLNSQGRCALTLCFAWHFKFWIKIYDVLLHISETFRPDDFQIADEIRFNWLGIGAGELKHIEVVSN